MWKELNDSENAKGDPISEPFGIILFSARFDGMNRNVRWIQHTNNVAQQLSANSENQIKGTEWGSTWKAIQIK